MLVLNLIRRVQNLHKVFSNQRKKIYRKILILRNLITKTSVLKNLVFPCVWTVNCQNSIDLNFFRTLTKHSPTRGKRNFEKISFRSQVIAKMLYTVKIVIAYLLATTGDPYQRAQGWRPASVESNFTCICKGDSERGDPPHRA